MFHRTSLLAEVVVLPRKLNAKGVRKQLLEKAHCGAAIKGQTRERGEWGPHARETLGNHSGRKIARATETDSAIDNSLEPEEKKGPGGKEATPHTSKSRNRKVGKVRKGLFLKSPVKGGGANVTGSTSPMPLERSRLEQGGKREKFKGLGSGGKKKIILN